MEFKMQKGPKNKKLIFGEELVVGAWSPQNEARFQRLSIAVRKEGRLSHSEILNTVKKTDCSELEVLNTYNQKPYSPLYVSRKRELSKKHESFESFPHVFDFEGEEQQSLGRPKIPHRFTSR